MARYFAIVCAFRKNHDEKENGSKETIQTTRGFQPQDGRAKRKSVQVARVAPKSGDQIKKTEYTSYWIAQFTRTHS
jgi:hypothetical protein